MQDVRPFIQLFRYDLSDHDHDHFQKMIINTNNIQLVEWQEDWDFVAFVVTTDHPEQVESFIEDYGSPAEARKRYQSVLTMLGANDATAMDREKRMKEAVRQNAKTDEWIRSLIRNAKAAGYKPFEDGNEDKEDPHCENCKSGNDECCDGCAYEGACNKPEDVNEEEADQAEVNPDGGNDTEAPAEPEGHLD